MTESYGFSAADAVETGKAADAHTTNNLDGIADAHAYTPTPASFGRTDDERRATFASPHSALSSEVPFEQRAASPRGAQPTASALETAKIQFAPQSANFPSRAQSAKVPSAADSLASSGGGGSDEEARRDNEDFKAAMAKIRGALRQLVESEDQPERREQLMRLIAQTDVQTADADKVVQAGPGQSPDRAFRLAAGHAELADDIEDAQEAAAGDEESIWEKIRRWLRRAGRKLYALISRLLTIKEWSLTGTVGTGVLGLTQASISVTFGR